MGHSPSPSASPWLRGAGTSFEGRPGRARALLESGRGTTVRRELKPRRNFLEPGSAWGELCETQRRHHFPFA